jgi:lysine 6-dehydrogenase
MGSAVVQDLMHTVEKKDLEKLGIGDVDLARAEQLAKSTSGGQPHRVDVTNIGGLASILEGYDAVVNATWYENNLHVMQACLKAGCSYDDLGGLFHVTRQQLLLDAEARSRGISAVVGGGESPGITNVMCALAAEGMDAVESIKIYAGAREVGQHEGVLVFPFSVSTVIDEYTKKPVEFLNGQFTEVPVLSGDEEITFPEPVGKNHYHYSLHSEPATLPASIGRGVKNVEFRLGISEKLLKTLAPLSELGLLADEPKIPVDGRLVAPREFVVSFFSARTGEELERWVALKTVVTGVLSNGERCTTSCDLVCAPGSYGLKNATAFLTGVAGSIFGQYLAAGKIAKGVISPEDAIDGASFVRELERRGISITKKTNELLI